MYIIHLSVWAPPSANGHDLPMRLTASHTCVLLDFFTHYMKVFWGRIWKCLEEFELCLCQKSLDIILKVTL